MNRWPLENLVSLATMVVPISLAYFFCPVRTAPRLDHRTVASTWSFCSRLRWAVFFPSTSFRSQSSRRIVPAENTSPKNITTFIPTTSFIANPFYKAPKLQTGQIYALAAIFFISFGVLLYVFIAWTRGLIIDEQSLYSIKNEFVDSTENVQEEEAERAQEKEAEKAKSSINRRIEQMRTSADKLKENCDTLDETHKQIETKFDDLTFTIKSIPEKQETSKPEINNKTSPSLPTGPTRVRSSMIPHYVHLQQRMSS